MKKTANITIADLPRRLQRSIKRKAFKETTFQMMARVYHGAKNPKRYFKAADEGDAMVKTQRALPINMLMKAKEARLKAKEEGEKKIPLDEKKP